MDQYLNIPSSEVPETLLNHRPVVVFVPHNCLPTELATLNKILTACRLDIAGQVSIIHVEQPISGAAVLAKSSKPLAYVLTFGLQPQHIGLQWLPPRYEWIRDGDTRWIFAERLGEIGSDMNKKKLLWASLKDIKGQQENSQI